MRTTTIKVDRAVGNRLACIARARGTTMGALLDTESRRLEAEQHWTDIESAYERLQREDPEVWVSCDRFNALPIQQAIVYR